MAERAVVRGLTIPVRNSCTGILDALAPPRSPFPLSLCGLRAFANDEGTRSFVSAMVAAGEQRVVALVRAVDGAFAAHGLPTFYEVSGSEGDSGRGRACVRVGARVEGKRVGRCVAVEFCMMTG